MIENFQSGRPEKKPRSIPKKIAEQIEGQSWEQIITAAAAPHSSDLEPAAADKRAEVLKQFEPAAMLAGLPAAAYDRLDNLNQFSGFVFESLVNRELNELAAEDCVLADFILRCLKNPRLVGVGDFSLKNPDHLAVEVDRETREVRITGMAEIKMDAASERARYQVRDFYQNIKTIVEAINQNIKMVKKAYKLEHTVPGDNIKLLGYRAIKKLLVLPQAQNFSDQRKEEQNLPYFEQKGWQPRHSVFTRDHVYSLAAFLMNHYQQHQKEIDQLRGANKPAMKFAA